MFACSESSRGGTRTPDPVINSHLLYQLSYSGKLLFNNNFAGARRYRQEPYLHSIYTGVLRTSHRARKT